MIPLSVSEIHCTRGFCDEQDEQQDEELGILVVGFSDPIESCCARKQWDLKNMQKQASQS